MLLFSHGEETNAFLYTNLHEDIASRGYVVVGVDHPGAALFVAYSDGSVVPYSEAANLSERVSERAADIRFVRDQLRTKPFRTLSAELSEESITREEATSIQASAWARDERLLASAGPPSYRVTLHEAEHGSFRDEPLLRDAEDTKSLKLMTMIRGLVAQLFEATLSGRQESSFVATDNDDLEIEVLAQE